MKGDLARLEELIRLLPKDLLDVLQRIYSRNLELVKENKKLKRQLTICNKDHGQKTTDLNS